MTKISLLKTQNLFYLIMALFPLSVFEFLPTSLILIFSGAFFVRIFKSFGQITVIILLSLVVLYIKNIYGNLYSPEPVISALAAMCMGKFLSRPQSNYKIERYLGFLWMGTFSLFRSDLTFILLLGAASLFIIKTLQSKDEDILDLKSIFKFKNISIKNFVFGLITIMLLFVFFPRIHGFLPNAGRLNKAQIGYSKEINNSSISELLLSSKVAFYAETNTKLDNNKLYWRGRVHTFTDGYNWRPSLLLPEIKNISDDLPNLENKIKTSMRYEQNFNQDIILLDSPAKVLKTNLNVFKRTGENTFATYIGGKKVQLEAISFFSDPRPSILIKNKEKFLQLPEFLPAIFKDMVNKFPPISKANGGLTKHFKYFRSYLSRNDFRYTLKPGDVSSLAKFMAKGKGYCSHFASLLALTLRYKGVPARLVSGFQGGHYNEVGGYYTVRSNDAHAWVEYYHDGTWKRVDPTGYVSPDRLAFGGEVFLNSEDPESSEQLKRDGVFKYYYSAKLYWETLNYKVSSFFNSYDREKQNKLSNIFKMPTKIFYLFGLMILLILTIVFTLLISKQSKLKKLSPLDQAFNKFLKKLKKYDVFVLETDGLDSLLLKSNQSNKLSDDKEIIVIGLLQEYFKLKYSKQGIKSNVELIIQLKRF